MKTQGSSSVYKLYYSTKQGKWSREKIADLEGSTQASLYSKEGNCLYIATYKALVRLSLSDNNVTTLISHSYWCDLGVNSIVELDGSLYMGTRMAVLEYVLSSEESYWYPVDYKTYLSE